MKKEQVIGFLKAPFSKSFITSYLFNFFALLSIPLLSRLISLLFQNLEKMERLSKTELSPFLTQLLLQNIHQKDVLMAGIGVMLAYIFLFSYALLLTHKIAIGKKGVFDAERLSFTLSEILYAVPKFLGFVFLCCFVSSVFIGVLVLANVLIVSVGMMIFKALGVILLLLCLLGSLYVFCRGICYLLTFNLIFHRDFILTDFFRYHKVQSFFVAYKKKVFIAWLLFFVMGQMVYTLYSSIGMVILEKVLIVGGILEAVHVSNVFPIALGIFVCGFFVTYLTLLQAVVSGKIIMWITKK